MVKKTLTAIFMAPTLQFPINSLKNNGFLNAYIKDELNIMEIENAIYLLFKPKNLSSFKLFLENEYTRTKQIIEDYDYEGGFVVIVYELDSSFKKDFNLIKKGKYSKTSKKFQKLFPESIDILKDGLLKKEKSLQYRVFNKTQDLIDYWEDKLNENFHETYEVWEGFDETKEILNIKKLKI